MNHPPPAEHLPRDITDFISATRESSNFLSPNLSRTSTSSTPSPDNPRFLYQPSRTSTSRHSRLSKNLHVITDVPSLSFILDYIPRMVAESILNRGYIILVPIKPRNVLCVREQRSYFTRDAGLLHYIGGKVMQRPQISLVVLLIDAQRFGLKSWYESYDDLLIRAEVPSLKTRRMLMKLYHLFKIILSFRMPRLLQEGPKQIN